MMGEVFDESTVEVGKAKEGLYFLLIGQNRPFSYSGNLGSLVATIFK
jgi:hypothetical protein